MHDFYVRAVETLIALVTVFETNPSPVATTHQSC
jgi:hypothetical protein